MKKITKLFKNTTAKILGYIDDNKESWINDYLAKEKVIKNTDLESYIEENKISGKNVEVLSLTWENYAFNGAGTGGTVVNTKVCRTQTFTEKGLYLICFPDELKVTYNVKNYTNNGKRLNISSYHPVSMFNDGLVRAYFERKNGTELLTTDEILNEVMIYRIASTRSDYDVVIAANDTNEYKKAKADIILDGINDTKILSALLGCYHSIKVLLYGGTYNITEMWTYSDTSKIAFSFNDYNYDGGSTTRRYICIDGEMPCTPQSEDTIKFYVSQELHESLSDTDMYYFIIGSPYSVGDTVPRNATSCKLSNFNIIGYKYDKPITYIDTTRCLSTMIDSVNVRSWCENITSYNSFEDTPNSECTGIRVGRGSNYGIQNYVKHSNVWYCGKGIACNGEHFIFEDVKVHHDYIGFVFGDRATVGHFEHPNIMNGCSIEGCYRLMCLSKNGVTEEGDFVYNYDKNLLRSTLIITGTSTETTWHIPTNEVTGDTTTQTTLPILEILKGAYRGRIEIDYPKSPFEEGSCQNMKYIAYYGKDTLEG